jgi:serine/threonine-protein kinase RsbW
VTESAEPATPSTDGVETGAAVELRVPASSAYVAVLRSVTAGLAARCDLTLDEIEDLRIAVDEACALLLPLAPPGASLTADFTMAAGQLVVVASLPTRDGATLNREGFGWTVLDALASAVVVGGQPGTVSIELTKTRDHAGETAL